MITTTTSTTALSGLENSRGARSRLRGSHDECEFSNQSIMHAMEKFVRTVQEMDDTILVPCRLLDLKVGDSSDPTQGKVPLNGLLHHADLYALYTMIKAVKNDLLWGQNVGGSSSTAADDTTIGTTYIPSGVSSLPAQTQTTNTISNSTSNQQQTYSSLPVVKTHSRTGSASNIKPSANGQQPTAPAAASHMRRPSTGSLVSAHSLASISLSDTDSETGNENDSGIEEGSLVEPSVQIALNFRKHLIGLYKSLGQLTSAASYLTLRYQHDVGGSV